MASVDIACTRECNTDKLRDYCGSPFSCLEDRSTNAKEYDSEIQRCPPPDREADWTKSLEEAPSPPKPSPPLREHLSASAHAPMTNEASSRGATLLDATTFVRASRSNSSASEDSWLSRLRSGGFCAKPPCESGGGREEEVIVDQGHDHTYPDHVAEEAILPPSRDRVLSAATQEGSESEALKIADSSGIQTGYTVLQHDLASNPGTGDPGQSKFSDRRHFFAQLPIHHLDAHLQKLEAKIMQEISGRSHEASGDHARGAAARFE